MNNASEESYLNQVTTLLTQLTPELINLRVLIKKMMKIDSPYKDKIRYITLLVNKQNQLSTRNNIAMFVDSIVEELPKMTELFTSIVNDEHYKDDYVKIGALEDYFMLQDNIKKIVNSCYER